MLLIPGECAHWQQMRNSALAMCLVILLLLVTPPGAAGVTDQQVSSWPLYGAVRVGVSFTLSLGREYSRKN